MLICEILVVYTLCNTAISKDLTPTHQLRDRFSQPPIPLNPYPYQEDLTSTVQFLKEETSTKKNQIRTLIKLLKKVLTKHMDVLKEKEENDDNKSNMVGLKDAQDLKKEFFKENNTAFEKKDQTHIKEFKTEIVDDVKRENIINEIYNIDNSMVDFQTPQDYNKVISNPNEIIKSISISSQDIVENYPLDYIRDLRPKPYSKNLQEPYVLERPEPKTIEMYDTILEKSEKMNEMEANAKIVAKNNPENRFKKQTFFIPYVKASDILNDKPKYIPKEAYCEDNLHPKTSSDVMDIQSTLENPVTNYISCSDSSDTVAMLFKPKTISLMQAYGNLLKKITVTVLVPFHVTKLVA